jgi:hypothetical protein
MRRSSTLLLTLAGAAVAVTSAAVASAADFAGTYAGPTLSVDLSPDGSGGYTGTFHLGQQNMPCRARPDGYGLAGTFDAGGASYAFTATLAGDAMTVSSGGKQFTVTLPTAPATANPLATAGASPAPALPDVTELAHTATGRTLLLTQPSATTADAALDGALPRLTRAVGASITVQGRFADAKQPDRGGASFTATVDGRPVHGVTFCGRSTAGGEDVSVAYCAVDAPQADWQTLTAALPHQVKLTTYSFPDGTGSIGLAEGWTCDAKSAADPVIARGPDGQNVIMGSVVAVNGSRSPAAHMRQMGEQVRKNLEDTYKRLGRQPPPPPRAAPVMDIFGEFDDPVPLFQQVYPQINAMAQTHGQPPRQIERVLDCTSVPPSSPGNRAQLVALLWLEGSGATATHYKSMARMEANRVGNYDVTLLVGWSVRARADTFDRAAPTLWSIARSFTIDGQRLAEVGDQRRRVMMDDSARAMAAQQQRFDQQQQLSFQVHQQQMDASAQRFNQFESSINAQNMASHRAAQDFTEMVTGYQKVVDTRTGEVMHVDYYDSQAIVQGLNDGAGDPHEYVAVHRRDEVYPLDR